MHHVVWLIMPETPAAHRLEQQRRQKVAMLGCLLARLTAQIGGGAKVPRSSVLARYRRHYAAGQKSDQVAERLPHAAAGVSSDFPSLAAVLEVLAGERVGGAGACACRPRGIRLLRL